MAGFQYRRPSNEAMQQKASQSIGNFEGFIKDEYQKFTPKKGDNAIRILPRHANEEAASYSEEVWVHYNVGPDKASVLCPLKMANQPCPVCEERARAERRGDQETTSELRPGRRVIFWVLDRKEEAKGPLVFDCPPTVDRDIAKVAKDRETGRYEILDDPEQGRDVYFDRDGEGLNTKYGGYQLGKRSTSVDDKYLEFITNNPLLDTLRIRSYDEIKILFEGGTTSSSTPAASEKREEKPAEETRPVSSRPTLVREPTRDEDEASLQRDREALQGTTHREPEPEQVAAAAPPSGKSRAEMLKERFATRK
jgi:hypothetical protein